MAVIPPVNRLQWHSARSCNGILQRPAFPTGAPVRPNPITYPHATRFPITARGKAVQRLLLRWAVCRAGSRKKRFCKKYRGWGWGCWTEAVSVQEWGFVVVVGVGLFEGTVGDGELGIRSG